MDLPGPVWLEQNRPQRDVEYYMHLPLLEPSQLVAIERHTSSTLAACEERLNFLQSEPAATFGVIPKNVKLSVILQVMDERVFSLLQHLQTTQQQVQFLVGNEPVLDGYQPFTQGQAALVRGKIDDFMKNGEWPANIFESFKSALQDSLLEKIVVLLGPEMEEPVLSEEQLQHLEDVLVGSRVNLTVALLDESHRKMAEKIVNLNQNPYNRIVSSNSSVELDDVRKVKADSQRIMQFCKQIRNGTCSSTKLLRKEEEEEGEMLSFRPAQQPLQLDVFTWLKENNLQAKRIDIFKALDIIGRQGSTYVKVLDKEVQARTLRNTKGLLELEFPDGVSRFVAYDKRKFDDLLEHLGNHLRMLKILKDALKSTGVGFIPRKQVTFVIDESPQTLAFMERLVTTFANSMQQINIVSSVVREDNSVSTYSCSYKDELGAFLKNLNDTFTILRKRAVLGAESIQNRELFKSWPKALSVALRVAKTENSAEVCLVHHGIIERSENLVEMIEDASATGFEPVISAVSIDVEMDQFVKRLSEESNGARVELKLVKNSLIPRGSSDFDLIDREEATTVAQSQTLIALKTEGAQTVDKPRVVQSASPSTRNFEKSKSSIESREWIQPKDTKKTKAYQRAIKQSYHTNRPNTTAGTKHPLLLRGSKAPAMLHKRQFYLTGGTCLDKGQTMYLDVSVKPPPVIPSCLKIPKEEEHLSSKDWLKRNGLKGLKINLERWERRITPGSKVYRGVLPIVRDRHCELQVAELEQLQVLSLEAARRYLKRIQWYLEAPHRLWFQSVHPAMARGNTVVLIDGSDSSRQWIYELIAAMRGLSRDIKGKLNVILFNDGVKSWQSSCYAMNNAACDDLALWMKCLRPNGGTSELSHGIRTALLSRASRIVIVSDAEFELAPETVFQEIMDANREQIPLHFIVPTKEYRQPHHEFYGYTSLKTNVDKMMAIIKKVAKMYGGSVCAPPSPSAAQLVLERIAAAQATEKDDSFSPSVFKNCSEIVQLMKEMRLAQKNAQHCQQWIEAASKC
ncbi:Oidioi.mRNA.OKI2018_I69.XSR.g16578.t1.cds [Oikopleura dioica]|uniref:Oidioi.mRNA.OKI2018_I69.XSR.g16578.t1.cds n=1 Tax=Oikopleura dioica TaxID=34765 RepID=A0ABN7SIE3_OIKDI|nr:Oidioi.mRNA.OKI2018_I69.XSR.g16578.t1.cds [Oikopleura dioica]